MKIVADENMPNVEALFGGMADEIVRLPGRTMSRQDLMDADVLLVRSVTRVDRDLLDGTNVSFVGSATIGTDHVDQDYLNSRNIPFHHSPGCNADSVVDYVLAAVLAVKPADVAVAELSFGVVGCGNVGGRLALRLQAMGLDVVKNDPPLAAQQRGDFVALEEITRCDVICLHTPLTKGGSHPTWHLFDETIINALKPGTILINAGRGAVINESALLARMQLHKDLHLVLDVWETEPQVSPELLALTEISTPHIAGYSLDGKLRGSWMLYRALCEHLGLPYQPEQPSTLQLPEPIMLANEVDKENALTSCVSRVYDIHVDSDAMRKSMNEANIAVWAIEFDGLRKCYPIRREFSNLKVIGATSEILTWLAAAGFDCQSC